MRLFKKKSFKSVIDDAKQKTGLAKTLNGFDLILLGIGVIVGTGIFALTGLVASEYAGPGVVLSYAIAGVTCIFVALAYVELAVLMPTSGSVYSYAYVAFGEIFAWIIASALILELVLGAATVAGSWSFYISNLLSSGGYEIPFKLRNVPIDGGIINLPAIFITLLTAYFVYLGTKESKTLNAILVIIKIIALSIFTFLAAPHFDYTNIENFMPNGLDNVLIGSSILFFAFIGFGGLSAAAEECKDPKKDLTIGIIGSLLISTICYVIVSGLVVGAAPFSELAGDSLSYVLTKHGHTFGSMLVTIGASIGMVSVLLMYIFTITRILYVISRDGLFPSSFAKIHKKYHTPHMAIIYSVICVIILTGFCKFEILAKMASMGALIEYSAAMAIAVYLRVKMPELERKFKCPALFIIAPIGLVATSYLFFKQLFDKHGNLIDTGQIAIYWFGGAIILYFIRIAFLSLRSPSH